MATPHVSGVVALLAGLHPEYTAEQLVARVLATTKPLGSLAKKTRTGGMVDAAFALGVAGSRGTARPDSTADRGRRGGGARDPRGDAGGVPSRPPRHGRSRDGSPLEVREFRSHPPSFDDTFEGSRGFPAMPGRV